KWAGAMAKLKQQAETAKIRVSQDDSALIEIDYLCDDDRGDRVALEYTLTRVEVERLAAPFLHRSLNITRKVMEEARLGTADVEKVILVGGPTLMPALRERLADPDEGLGIPLETGVDPLTVVARGAAIFAGTQRLPREADAGRPQPGRFTVELEYQPVGIETEPPVGGKVVPREGVDLAGHTVELVNVGAQPPWRSGKLLLSPEGTFLTRRWAERGRANTFRIELSDAAGNALEVQPETFAYTVGMTVTEPPLIHAVGVAMASNTVDEFFEKGAALPLRKRSIHRTVFTVRPGGEGPVLRIPVVEGQKARADRNRLIGCLEIPGSKVRREVPSGSEVEITLDIDTSRRVQAHALIPILNQEFEGVLTLELPTPDRDALQKEVETETARLAAARAKAEETDDPAAAERLQKIDDERTAQDVESLLDASRAQPDSLDECQKRLLDLRGAIDEVEDALEWPGLVAEAEAELARMRQVVAEHGTPADQQLARSLERETRLMLESGRRDTDTLRDKVAAVSGHTFSVLREQPGFWVGFLHELEGMKGQMRDPAQAEQYVAQGLRAINNNDLAALRSAVQQLITLLPVDRQRDVAFGAITQRA
ncbi:MAG TPA: Hsp70 family protein, partial [Thermoanaerobaculia bacterium]|nr:Hsp70 family protein [Thermoanaerobaculia bacterium]